MPKFTPVKKTRKDIARPHNEIVYAHIGPERKLKLDNLCSKHNLSLSEMIRQMIDHCFEEDK